MSAGIRQKKKSFTRPASSHVAGQFQIVIGFVRGIHQLGHHLSRMEEQWISFELRMRKLMLDGGLCDYTDEHLENSDPQNQSEQILLLFLTQIKLCWPAYQKDAYVPLSIHHKKKVMLGAGG